MDTLSVGSTVSLICIVQFLQSWVYASFLQKTTAIDLVIQLALNTHPVTSREVGRKKGLQLASVGSALVYLKSWSWKMLSM